MLKWILNQFKRTSHNGSHKEVCIEPCCEASKMIWSAQKVMDESSLIKESVVSSIRKLSSRELGLYSLKKQ